MALNDLLWACPICGEVGGVDRDGLCHHCGARFRRARGASIEAVRPDGTTEIAAPADWVDRLPDPASLLRGDPIRRARVLARVATGSDVVRGEGGYLNRIETYGPEWAGTLELGPGGAIFTSEGSEPMRWPFEALTAVQASSRTLQLKGRGMPLVSFRFTDDSMFLWELLVRQAVRAHWRRTGKGEVAEFQPRIVAR